MRAVIIAGKTCRQIAMAAGYQRTSRSKNTLQMTSFCAPAVAPPPFLQPSGSAPLTAQKESPSSSALQLNVAVRRTSGRPGSCNAVLCCSLQLHYSAAAAAAGGLAAGALCGIFLFLNRVADQSVGPHTLQAVHIQGGISRRPLNTFPRTSPVNGAFSRAPR